MLTEGEQLREGLDKLGIKYMSGGDRRKAIAETAANNLSFGLYNLLFGSEKGKARQRQLAKDLPSADRALLSIASNVPGLLAAGAATGIAKAAIGKGIAKAAPKLAAGLKTAANLNKTTKAVLPAVADMAIFDQIVSAPSSIEAAKEGVPIKEILKEQLLEMPKRSVKTGLIFGGLGRAATAINKIKGKGAEKIAESAKKILGDKKITDADLTKSALEYMTPTQTEKLKDVILSGKSDEFSKILLNAKKSAAKRVEGAISKNLGAGEAAEYKGKPSAKYLKESTERLEGKIDDLYQKFYKSGADIPKSAIESELKRNPNSLLKSVLAAEEKKLIKEKALAAAKAKPAGTITQAFEGLPPEIVEKAPKSALQAPKKYNPYRDIQTLKDLRNLKNPTEKQIIFRKNLEAKIAEWRKSKGKPITDPEILKKRREMLELEQKRNRTVEFDSAGNRIGYDGLNAAEEARLAELKEQLKAAQKPVQAPPEIKTQEKALNPALQPRTKEIVHRAKKTFAALRGKGGELMNPDLINAEEYLSGLLERAEGAPILQKANRLYQHKLGKADLYQRGRDIVNPTKFDAWLPEIKNLKKGYDKKAVKEGIAKAVRERFEAASARGGNLADAVNEGIVKRIKESNLFGAAEIKNLTENIKTAENAARNIKILEQRALEKTRAPTPEISTALERAIVRPARTVKKLTAKILAAPFRKADYSDPKMIRKMLTKNISRIQKLAKKSQNKYNMTSIAARTQNYLFPGGETKMF